MHPIKISQKLVGCMAAQISQRFSFIPDGYNHDDIIYQWSFRRKGLFISILKIDRRHSFFGEKSLVCRIDRKASESLKAFSERAVSKWERSLASKYSWESLTPEVFTCRGERHCILKDPEATCRLKGAIKVAESTFLFWIFKQRPDNDSTNEEAIVGRLRVPYDFLSFDRKTNQVHGIFLDTLDTLIRSDALSSKIFRATELPSKLFSMSPNQLAASVTVLTGMTLLVGAIFLGDTSPILNYAVKLQNCNGKLWAFTNTVRAGVTVYDKYHPPIITSDVVLSPIDKTFSGFKFSPVKESYMREVGEENLEHAKFKTTRWIVGEKVIWLEVKRDEIKYCIRDFKTGNVSNFPLKKNLTREQVEEEMDRLSKCFVYFNDKERVEFFEIKYRWHLEKDQQEQKDWQLVLVMEDDGIYKFHILEMEQKSPFIRCIQSNLKAQYPIDLFGFSGLREFSPRTQLLLTERCGKAARDFVRSIPDESKERQKDDILSLSMKKIKILECERSEFVQVICEPKESKRSEIDPRINVTEHSWAVTLVRRDQKPCSNDVGIAAAYLAGKVLPKRINLNGQHAQIVIEGIAHRRLDFSYENLEKPDDEKEANASRTVPFNKKKQKIIEKGQYFILGCHFVDTKDVRIDFFPRGAGIEEKKVEFMERSKVWKRSRYKVFNMLNKIRNQYTRKEREGSRERLEESYREEHRKRDMRISEQEIKEYARDIIPEEPPLPELDQLGRWSVKNKGKNRDSCISYCIATLEMADIHLDPTYIGKIIGKERGITTHTPSSDFTYSEKYHETHPPEESGLL